MSFTVYLIHFIPSFNFGFARIKNVTGSTYKYAQNVFHLCCPQARKKISLHTDPVVRKTSDVSLHFVSDIEMSCRRSVEIVFIYIICKKNCNNQYYKLYEPPVFKLEFSHS
jgi:hypothetical protein